MNSDTTNRYRPLTAHRDCTVPMAALDSADQWTDITWGNDACASALLRFADRNFRLWFDHADPELRECSGSRYAVVDAGPVTDAELTTDGEVVFETNDSVELVRYLSDGGPRTPKPSPLMAAMRERGLFTIGTGGGCTAWTNKAQTFYLGVDGDSDIEEGDEVCADLYDDDEFAAAVVFGTDHDAVLAWLDAGAPVARFAIMDPPNIIGTASAEAWMRRMHDEDLLFHLDDDPSDIVDRDGFPTFRPWEFANIRYSVANIRKAFKAAGRDPFAFILDVIGAD